jgi:ArsR family transcriptional regulator, arsenate/arsenite/antimonite-responsive transcriptional repressor
MTGCNCQKCFSSLGIESRYKIYNSLKENKRKTVSEVCEFLGLKQPTVTYHLKQMVENGLLKSEKKGKFVYFEINGVCPQTKRTCILA